MGLSKASKRIYVQAMFLKSVELFVFMSSITTYRVLFIKKNIYLLMFNELLDTITVHTQQLLQII